ncbi:MAG: amino acid transporter [Chlamydiales bacterium]|jgi:amino acid transporter
MLNFISHYFNKILQARDLDVRDQGFNTFTGVFIPNITMMFGIIIFLRLALITGYVDFSNTLLIGAMSLLFMLVTSCSVSSIVTNLQIRGGGIYYITSRTLGIEIGGAIGLAIYLSQVLSIALCITGFAYSIKELFPNSNLSLIEAATLLILTPLSIYSTKLALKCQTAIFAILMLAIASIFLGSAEYLEPISSGDYFPHGFQFWDAFAILYPAFTGIEVGMAMSGNLKRPGWSISIGTVLSLCFAFTTYMSIAYFAYSSIPSEILRADPYVLLHFSRFEPLVHLGIWVATLSSALGSIIGAPKMLQVLSEDSVIPKIFSKSFGQGNEPRYGIAFTALLAFICAILTRIDQLIPILAMISLITYGTLNFVAFFGELNNNPSWRPSIRPPFYIPLFGVVLACFFMFAISPLWAWVGIALVVAIFLFLRRQDISVNFNDIRESLVFFLSTLLLRKMDEPTQSALNWHPQLMVFVASPQAKKKLLYLSHSMTKRSGMLTFVTILQEDSIGEPEQVESFRQTLKRYYDKCGISCFVEVLDAPTILEGISNYIRVYGVGGMQPNTVVLGFPKEETPAPFDHLCEILTLSRRHKKNIILFRESGKGSLKTFSRRKSIKNKTIHIWWDGNDRLNFELMLNYLYSMHEGIVWRGAQVVIRAIASNESAQGYIQEYLDDYIHKNRLKAQSNVKICEEEEPLYRTANRFSQQAHLVFIGIHPYDLESGEASLDYLKTLHPETCDLKDTLFVACNDEINHRDIY